MNYWLAEPAKLTKVHTALFDLTDVTRHPGLGTGAEEGTI